MNKTSAFPIPTTDEDDVNVVRKGPYSVIQADNNQIPRILELEGIAFSGEAGTLDPAETKEGLEAFLANGGEIFVLDSRIHNQPSGFLERIPLERIKEIDYTKLDENSPFRQFCSAEDVVKRATASYDDKGKSVWYLHGVGVQFKGIQHGSMIYSQVLPKPVKEGLENDINFGYIDIGPEKDNINVPSFKLSFKFGFVVDEFENEVYSQGVPYLRVSRGVGYALDSKDKVSVDLKSESYKKEIQKTLGSGYVGTEIVLDADGKADKMMFYRKVELDGTKN